MGFIMDNAPKSVCILRLSSIGDVTHMVPVVRTMQTYWPNTKLTWIIGKNEAALIHDIPNVEFIQFDKTNVTDSCKKLINKMKQRQFDVLLCAQVSLRANLLSTLIPASIKLGYDRARSKNLHSLFINRRIHATSQQHVLDSFFSFIEHLGLHHRDMRWGYNIPEEAHEFAAQHLANDRFKVIISPCSRHPLRSWPAKRYAAVANYAMQSLDAQVILCGGNSAVERQTGLEIERQLETESKKKTMSLNLIGKDTLKKFLALLQRADALIAPDSGPVHMATGVDTPVVGLYAASNPNRSGPYFSRQWCVDKYDLAARTLKNKPANKLKWGTKLEYPGVMKLISVEDVISKLTELAQQTRKSET